MLQNRTDHLQNLKYTLKEIVENHQAVDKVHQIKEFMEKAPNLNKIRKDNRNLLEIKLKTEILLRKIIQAKEKILQQSFGKRRQSNKN